MQALRVIGFPVKHSKSPVIHRKIAEILGVEVEYLCEEVQPGHLEEFLAGRAQKLDGFNATMPFKEELVPFLDGIDPLAERLGAVNTVCIKNGKLYGYNTDCMGYVAALREFGFDPAGKNVLLLGAGGAARAVALGLANGGARVVKIANRTQARAAQAAALDPALSPLPWTPEALAQAAAQADLLVNATSLGMEGQGQFEDFSFLGALPQGAVVSDLIYHPEETGLLARARELGHPAMNGLPLLVHQAVLAFQHFTGLEFEAERVLPGVYQALRR